MNLRCENLLVHHAEHAALAGVSFDLPAGSQAMLLGRAGSGKTTLLKALAGLQLASEGQVFWDEVSVASLSPADRRHRQAQLGMVFQTDALFDSMTVLENVLMPLVKRKVPADEARQRALEALESVGLEGAGRMRPGTLSGGMRKRAGIARAIVARPEVLLADEPLAGLDPATALKVMELLFSVSRGKTLLVAAAEPQAGMSFGRWLFLERGWLVHDGPPAEALLELDDHPFSPGAGG